MKNVSQRAHTTIMRLRVGVSMLKELYCNVSTVNIRSEQRSAFCIVVVLAPPMGNTSHLHYSAHYR